ncbi:MAG: inorganic diphosphatase [Winogradskyella arenosi]
MNKATRYSIIISLMALVTSCNFSNTNTTSEQIIKSFHETDHLNLLTDINPQFEDAQVNAVIEIPAGTIDKWELNKNTGQIEWERIEDTPRKINYLGYPGNYGMIPKTLIPKHGGGDGDPLDILVLGPPAERGDILRCKIIGLLYLTDSGEQDHKLIAVSDTSVMYTMNSISELDKNYQGISEIIALWFTNYKASGLLKSEGYGSQKEALQILENALKDYAAN